MKKFRTPQQKKQLSYQNDYPVLAEYPHAFRKQWPKKIALAERNYRRSIKQDVNQQLAILKTDSEADIDLKVIDRTRYTKWDHPTLKEVVNKKLERRITRFGWNYFKNPYCHELDYQRFARLIDTIVEGSTEFSKALASQFEQWLQSPGRANWWLKEFFAEAPASREKLVNWIAKMNDQS